MTSERRPGWVVVDRNGEWHGEPWMDRHGSHHPSQMAEFERAAKDERFPERAPHRVHVIGVLVESEARRAR